LNFSKIYELKILSANSCLQTSVQAGMTGGICFYSV